MTCIVGIKTPLGVHIGGDSAGSSSNYVAIRADKKVFKIGEFIFGFTTSFRMGQLIQYKFKPPTPPDDDDKLFEYMVTDFVDGIKEVFEENGFLHEDDNGVDSGGIFMVGYKNRLFIIWDDFQVDDREIEYSAIGCGQEYAYGSLYSTTNLDVENRILNALSAAEYHGKGVAAPFHIVATI